MQHVKYCSTVEIRHLRGKNECVVRCKVVARAGIGARVVGQRGGMDFGLCVREIKERLNGSTN